MGRLWLDDERPVGMDCSDYHPDNYLLDEEERRNKQDLELWINRYRMEYAENKRLKFWERLALFSIVICSGLISFTIIWLGIRVLSGLLKGLF
jgi:hypothetical protein